MVICAYYNHIQSNKVDLDGNLRISKFCNALYAAGPRMYTASGI